MKDIADREYVLLTRNTCKIHVNTRIGTILCKYTLNTHKYAYRAETPPKVSGNTSSTARWADAESHAWGYGGSRWRFAPLSPQAYVR